MIHWGIKYNQDVDDYYKTLLPLVKKDKRGFIERRLKEITGKLVLVSF